MAKTLKYAFRITHINNIPYIVSCGLVRANSPLRDEHFVYIGDAQVIRIRDEKDIKGYHLSEYVPFYLGPRSPMLYVIQHGYNGVAKVSAGDIVYCVVRLDDLVRDDIDCIFTDGHALSNLTTFYPKNKLPLIDNIVSYEDVYSSQWNIENDMDLKRRKEAELLVHNDLPSQYIRGYVVYNEKAKQKIEAMGVASDMIAIVPTYYF